ncbi:MAG: hypothetical protein ACRBN8_21045 [Nannocystales bacterium]
MSEGHRLSLPDALDEHSSLESLRLLTRSEEKPPQDGTPRTVERRSAPLDGAGVGLQDELGLACVAGSSEGAPGLELQEHAGFVHPALFREERGPDRPDPQRDRCGALDEGQCLFDVLVHASQAILRPGEFGDARNECPVHEKVQRTRTCTCP